MDVFVDATSIDAMVASRVETPCKVERPKASRSPNLAMYYSYVKLARREFVKFDNKFSE